ncbi:MAG TPA: D-alanyl-D-alanine carboxypeptidase/D-alanyl-D-alanine-endopeptidase [Candidatus Nitrosotenuis sp.]|nr:D-alanyl-D-alanine carboxypeptidase/D-alanyl-D-alanine-endopeptidase [Candidatus Nitrosotenuis sp.]
MVRGVPLESLPRARWTREGSGGLQRRVLILALALALLRAPLVAGAGEPDPWQDVWRGAQVGILAVRSADGQVLLEEGADLLLTPASSLKVVTAAAALRHLGPQARLATVVRALGPPDASGVVWGDLVLEGGGDATLTRADLARLADQLRAAGVRRVEGRLGVDGSVLAGPPLGPGWAWDDATCDFSAEVRGLTVDHGLALVRVAPGPLGQAPLLEDLSSQGFLQVHNRARTVPADRPATWDFIRLPGTEGTALTGEVPAQAPPQEVALALVDADLFAGHLLRQHLARRGIATGPVVRLPARGEPLARHLSPPLEEVLRSALATSDNLVMECLYRLLPEPLAGLPLTPESCRVVDGSGLSRYNRISARQLVEVLRATPDLRRLLPLAGSEGTMRGRLQGTAAAASVRAKTGSMSNVSSLCGYLFPGEPDEVVFAIIANGFLASPSESRRAEDRLVEALARQVRPYLIRGRG